MPTQLASLVAPQGKVVSLPSGRGGQALRSATGMGLPPCTHSSSANQEQSCCCQWVL